MKLSKILVTLVAPFIAVAAFAQDGEKVIEASVQASSSLSAGLGLGIAAMGGAIGQGLVAFAALAGIARNPGARGQVFVPMIIALALIESLVIYAFVVALTKIR